MNENENITEVVNEDVTEYFLEDEANQIIANVFDSQVPQKQRSVVRSTIMKLAAFAAVVLIGVGVTFVVSNYRPLVQAQRAVGNFGQEFSSRVQTTPFYAFNLLLGANGHYSTLGGNLLINSWGDVFDMSMEVIASPDGTRSIAHVSFAIDDDWSNLALNATVYADQEGIKFWLDLFGDNYYGFTFATFEQDFLPLANALELDQYIIDVIVDIVAYIEDMVEQLENAATSTTTEVPEYLQAFEDIIRDFIGDVDHSSRRDNGTTRVEFTVGSDTGVAFLMDLLEALQTNEALRSDTFAGLDGDMADDMWAMMDEIIAEGLDYLADMAEDAIYGDLTLALYIGSGSRLDRFTLHLDGAVGDAAGEITLTADFGANAFDRWYISVGLNDDVVTAAWELGSINNGTRNTITLSFDDEQFSVSSNLYNNGRFTLSFVDEEGFTGEHGGYFIQDGAGGFDFSLDTVYFGWHQEDSFDLSLHFALDGEIVTPASYVNIRDWDVDLIESWFDALASFD